MNVPLFQPPDQPLQVNGLRRLKQLIYAAVARYGFNPSGSLVSLHSRIQGLHSSFILAVNLLFMPFIHSVANINFKRRLGQRRRIPITFKARNVSSKRSGRTTAPRRKPGK